MFQLVLSEKLRAHLASVAEGAAEPPVVFDSFKPRYRESFSDGNGILRVPFFWVTLS